MMAGKKSAAERRNPLTPPDESLVSVWHEVITQIADPERLEEKEPKKRKREWEKNNKPKHYRGVPVEVREQVKAIAKELGVTADEVARSFIEYSLTCLKRGTLMLSGTPSQRRARMTLYASGAGWAENGWTPQPPPKRSGRKKDEVVALWREIAHYRLPDELHEQIKQVAGMAYPIGEVAAVLLKHGIESYKNGVLVLIPQPKIPKNLGWSGGQ
jgi:predicted DNA-binding protein